MKKEWLILLFILFIPAVSAEILMSQPDNTYNMKDSLDLQIILKPVVEVNDLLLVQLVCEEVAFDIYKNYFNLLTDEERVVDINFLIDNSLGIEEEKNCFIRASFGEESAESREFDITRKISIGTDLAKKIWDSGENLDISGTAIRMSGEGVEGFADILLEPAGVSSSVLVKEGSFNASLRIPESHSGEQILSIRVYEKNSKNEVTNEGSIEREIEIRQTLKEIRISFDSNSLIPREDLKYKAELIDQGGEVMEGDVAITIFKPNGLAFREEIKSSGLESELKIDTNFSAGYWKVEAVYGEISETKLFYVEERKDLMFSLINKTLIIANVGNVLFEGPVEVLIGSDNEIMQIKLDIGESRKFKISAPEGSYQVMAKEGNKEVNFGAVSLTGKAVNIGEVSEGIGDVIGNNIAVWILIALLIGVVMAMFAYRRGLTESLKILKKKKVKEEGVISRGMKYEAGVVLLNAPTKMNQSSMESVEKAIARAKDYGAGINFDGEHRILLFTPILTKKKENVEIALKVAREIEEILKDHNRKHTPIKYGIGLNFGHIIAENYNGKLRFVSVGNTISLAKRLSNHAKEEILASEAFHKRALNVGKFAKKDGHWKLENFADRSKHEGFIKGFLDSQRYNQK